MKPPQVYSDSSEDENKWEFIPTRNKDQVSRLHTTPHMTEASDAQCDPYQLDSLRGKMKSTVDVLKSILLRENFWERYSPYFKGVETVVAFGIGSPQNSVASRFQFAMLIALCQQLKCAGSKCFDPVMTKSDMDLAIEYGFVPLHRDTEDSSIVSSSKSKVLLFMPHCDRSLYEWVFQHKLRTWDATFISNYFSTYSSEYSLWEKSISCLTVEPFLLFEKDWVGKISRKSATAKRADKSTEIPNYAFNDMAIQRFNEGTISFIVDIWSPSNSAK